MKRQQNSRNYMACIVYQFCDGTIIANLNQSGTILQLQNTIFYKVFHIDIMDTSRGLQIDSPDLDFIHREELFTEPTPLIMHFDEDLWGHFRILYLAFLFFH